MTATQSAHAAASRVSNSHLLETLTRAGYLGYGLVHFLVAWIALQIAFGRSGKEGSQTGAFQTLAQNGFGRALLWAVCVGLAAMAVWQFFEALSGHRAKQGKQRVFDRVVSAVRTVIFAMLAISAGKIAAGGGSSSANRQQTATAKLMENGGGRFLVALIGLIILGVGVGLVVYGLKHKFLRNLRTAEMNEHSRRTARWLGTLGYSVRGVAFAIVGILVTSAAVTFDPAKSRGLDAAFRSVAAKPYGTPLLLLIALGFAAYGVYCLFQSRYRRI